MFKSSGNGGHLHARPTKTRTGDVIVSIELATDNVIPVCRLYHNMHKFGRQPPNANVPNEASISVLHKEQLRIEGLHE